MSSAVSAAAEGLRLVAALGLPANPTVKIAQQIVAGTVDPEHLVDAWGQYEAAAMARGQLAGVLWLCLGGQEGQAKARTAAATTTLSGRVSRMADQLSTLNQTSRAGLTAVVQAKADLVFTRAGKAATKNIRNAAVKSRLEQADPATALVMIADAGLWSHVDGIVQAIIEEVVADTVTQAENLIGEAQRAAQSMIEDAFLADVEGDEWPGAKRAALGVLESRFGMWLAGQAAGPNDLDPLSPVQLAEGQVPPQVVADTLHAAGGALVDAGRIVRDDAGQIQSADGAPHIEGVAAGAIAHRLQRQALAAWAEPVDAAARKPGINISGRLRSDLSKAGGRIVDQTGDLEPFWTWELGSPKTVHDPGHVRISRRGHVFRGSGTSDSDRDAAAGNPAEWPWLRARYIGDHKGCVCWKRYDVRVDELVRSEHADERVTPST